MYQSRIAEIIRCAEYLLSDIKPSDWYSQNRVMGTDNPFPGRFSYDKTPYTREIVDRFSPSDPAKIIAVMKAAQVGFSSGVIIAAICWIISQNPGNILHLTGNTVLSKLGVNKLDLAIDSCGLRDLIRPNTLRKKNSRTGDTNTDKEFIGGVYHSGGFNENEMRQIDAQYIFADDTDAAKLFSKDTGSITKLIETRAKAFFHKAKIFYCSTPQLKGSSIIEQEYLKGDQRRYNIPCPRCAVAIPLFWSARDGQAGIHYKWEKGRVIKGSVCYICQECSKAFTDKNKTQFLLDGLWIPTATAIDEYHTSYHLSGLYAPHGMYGWQEYVNDYLEACPPLQPRIEHLFQAFENLGMGNTYQPQTEAPNANAIQRNCRSYKPGTIPEQMSIRDGNGRVVLLTCSADMNGIMSDDNQDVRLDYEIKAWSEAGPSYSIIHGSIGTFQRGIGKTDDPLRKKWTYEDNKENSVWPEFEKIVSSIFQTDTPSKDSPTGFRRMGIQLSGLDCGYFSSFAYAFLDKTQLPIIGIKGEKDQKYIPEGVDAAVFKHGIERRQDYILKVGMLKDRLLGSYMGLTWAKGEESQPSNFMNFPEPTDGLYTFENYFEHYESEHKTTLANKDGSFSFRWEKVNSAVRNHMLDCAVYNFALRDIVVNIYAELVKIKGLQWRDYVRAVTTQ